MINLEKKQTDEGLRGNEKLEEAIKALQQNPTQEMLAHVLTVVRRRMRDKGQFVVAVDPPKADGQMRLRAIKTDDGRVWWSAFSGFEEEMRGSDSVMSTFLADIEQLLRMAVREESINGIILNPWNATLMLDKRLIQIILGEQG